MSMLPNNGKGTRYPDLFRLHRKKIDTARQPGGCQPYVMHARRLHAINQNFHLASQYVKDRLPHPTGIGQDVLDDTAGSDGIRIM